MSNESLNGAAAGPTTGPSPEQLREAIDAFGNALLESMRTTDGQLAFDVASLIINTRLMAMRLHVLVQELCAVTPLDSGQIDVRLLERLKVVTQELSKPLIAVANGPLPRNG